MRDFAGILIAIQLGLRESDICNLKISDFNWDEKTRCNGERKRNFHKWTS